MNIGESYEVYTVKEKTRRGKLKVVSVGESLFYFCEVVENHTGCLPCINLFG